MATYSNESYDADMVYGYDNRNPRYSFEETCVFMVMLSIFCVIGVTGNALVLYVYSQKRDRQVANHFILILASIDFITCFVIIPATMYYEYSYYHMVYDPLCKFYHFLISSNVPFSVLIMVAIAVDRYFCICHPFLQVLTLIRARLLTITMAIFAAILGVFVACANGTWLLLKESELNYDYDSPSISINIHDNVTHSNPYNYTNDKEDTMVLAYMDGMCLSNFILIGKPAVEAYNKFHTGLYLVCLIIIVVLYALIYRLVRARRAKRLEQQSMRLVPLNHDSTMSGSPVTDCVTIGNGGEGVKLCNGKTLCAQNATGDGHSKSPGDSVKSNKSSGQDNGETQRTLTGNTNCRRDSRRERMRIANLKTAAMLFVVTVVFFVTYLPAFLMLMRIVTWNVVGFYLYFANNVANPIIYSFMNKNFRDDLAQILKKRH